MIKEVLVLCIPITQQKRFWQILTWDTEPILENLISFWRITLCNQR